MFSSGNFKNSVGSLKISDIDHRKNEFKTDAKLVRYSNLVKFSI
jgi:hypothetical protein